MKALNFVGSSLDDLRNFPDEARRGAGFALYSVQCGLGPSDCRPMQIIGPGVKDDPYPRAGGVASHIRRQVLQCGLCAPRISEEEPEDRQETY